MKIIGIDPGYATVGYALLEKNRNTDQIRLIDFGVIKTSPKQDFPHRLHQIIQDFENLIDEFSPNILSIEELYFNSNIKTGIKVAEVRGAILYRAMKASLTIFEYNPLHIKLAVTGDGNADKTQVQDMIQKTFQLESLPKPDDASDAIAVALTKAFDFRSDIC